MKPWLSAFVFIVGLSSATLAQNESGTSRAISTNSAGQPAPVSAIFGSRGIHVHDPGTPIRCKDEYWIFYTGRGIPSFHSKDLMTWKPGPRVFTNSPGWVAQAVPANRYTHFWAPDITREGDRYLLYYSVSSFGKNRSAIGLATNPTLDPADPNFKWSDAGIVVQSTNTDHFNTIDPAVCRTADGKLWLSFGSYWDGIKLIELDPKTGKRIAPDSPMYSLARNDSIEASFIYFHDGFYYLFVNWGTCCRGVNSTYEIRVGRSQKITGPYLDKDNREMLHDGGTLFLGTKGSFIGPGHAAIFSRDGKEWFSCHFYDGTRYGTSTLAIMPLHWTASGWPEISGAMD